MSPRLATTEQPRQSARPASASQRLPCQVLPLAPEWHAIWAIYVTGHADGTIFHTLGWRDAVKDAFPHEDVYLLAIRDDRVVGVLPLFMVASRIAGRMLVSVPYGVGGGIIADDEDVANTLFAAAKQVMAERRCVTMDLRSPMVKSKWEGLRVDCDRSLEFSSHGLVRRPVNFDSCRPVMPAYRINLKWPHEGVKPRSGRCDQAPS